MPQETRQGKGDAMASDRPECGWRLGLCTGCELCSYRHDYGALDVKRLSAVIPVSAEQLVDAGMPLPPGVELAPPVKWTLRQRIRYRVREAIWSARRHVGRRIAGASPDEWEE